MNDATTATATQPAAAPAAEGADAKPTREQTMQRALARITAEIAAAKAGGVGEADVRRIAAEVAGPVAERVGRESAANASARDLAKLAAAMQELVSRLDGTGRRIEVTNDAISARFADVHQQLERLEELAGQGGGDVVVRTPEGLELGRVEGHVRPEFQKIAAAVAAGQNVMLVGPSGSGKTHLARQVAESLGLRFGFVSLTAGVSESRLYGRFVPTGENGSFRYVEAEFARFYREGGLFLLDEVDAADPNVLLALNAAVANGMMETPNPDRPVVHMHDDFRIVIAANTYGHGADRTYAGRNQLDGATLDRYAAGKFLIGYDEGFERKAGEAAVVAWVHALRRGIAAHGLRRTASTRLVLDGTRLVKAGFTLDEVKRGYFLDWPEHERELVGAE